MRRAICICYHSRQTLVSNDNVHKKKLEGIVKFVLWQLLQTFFSFFIATWIRNDYYEYLFFMSHIFRNPLSNKSVQYTCNIIYLCLYENRYTRALKLPTKQKHYIVYYSCNYLLYNITHHCTLLPRFVELIDLNKLSDRFVQRGNA